MSTPAKLYNVDLTADQIDFLLYGLGFLLSTSKVMSDTSTFWIREHHDAILPKLIGAKKRVVEEK